MKKLLFFFFTLTVSSFTYSQVTSFENLPISRVLIFDMDDNKDLNSALTVPEGKLWLIQQSLSPSYITAKLGDEDMRASQGAVFAEGTKLYAPYSLLGVNIIEYDLNAQTISLNTNDIKLDGKIKLFPNPTNSMLSLNSDKDYNIEVFDLNGRKIMEVEGNNLDMSNLSKAIYIVKAFDKASKETYSYKVVRN